MSVFPGRVSQFSDVQGSLTVNQTKTLADENASNGAQQSTGSGDSFSKAGSVVTLTDAGATWTSDDIGRIITVAVPVTTPGNAGSFIINAVAGGGTTVDYINSAGATEAYTGTWTITDPYSLEDDLNFIRTDRKLIKGTSNYYDTVPTYVRPQAIGTNRSKNLTNLLSVDGYATVRDVRQADIKIRPNVSIVRTTGTGDSFTFSTPTVTLTDSAALFTADDVGRYITIITSTTPANNGTFPIVAVGGGGTTVDFTNASGAPEAFTGTWSIGDAKLVAADETFLTAGFHFVAGDLNSFIVITNSTDADGTYRIKTVTNGETLELDGLASATTEVCSWELISAQKGILSSRSWADTTDRRGVPIADSGAEDETVYTATYADIINPIYAAGITKNDETKIWARSFGNQLDAERTATNEGTRFFVQLETGVNDGTASVASLESLSTRLGDAASVTNATTTVTGLASMTQEDIGRYITLYDAGLTGTPGHFKILTVPSATSVTVSRAAFGTDPNNGSIKWKISKHPANFDFYSGDRYQNNELSETWGRTTMIGGIISDAEIEQEVANLREFSGANLSQTAPTLTNTGNYYAFSDVLDPANSNLEELVQALNDQIGNRDYTGTILNDGETVTTSLQALATAIAGSSITRVIERLAAAVPKQTSHALPGASTYTLDGTNNGRNMFVFWRKQLRDPGSAGNGDDYEETNTTHITPYSRIEIGDHINYLILQ